MNNTDSKAPPGPSSGFGKETTFEDVEARIEWEKWAARKARENNQEAIAQGHDLARVDYEIKLEGMTDFCLA